MRNRLLVGVGLLVLGAALWFFFGRRTSPPTTTTGPAPVAEQGKPADKPAAPPAKPRGGDEAAAPEPHVEMEDDPPGALRLEGQVIDTDDRPVAGATVRLSANPPRTIKSEGDGSFVFDKLVSRQYRLEAHKDDALGGPVTVRLTARKEPVILVLKQAGGLEITVVTRGDKKPVPGAEVEVVDSADVSGTTDADGKVVLRGVEPGYELVVAHAKGLAPAQALVEVGPPSAGLTRLTLELRTGAAVKGTVVDAAGKPVAGARVRAEATSTLFGVPSGDRDSSISDARGAWGFEALPEGTFRFEARHDRFGPGTSAPVTLDGKAERDGVVITLEPGARLAGKVVTTAGAGVPGANVRVFAGGAGNWVSGRPRQAITDDQGTFEIAGLPRQKVEAMASSEEASSETTTYDLEAKPEQADVSLTLDQLGFIAGTVVNPKGEALPDVQVAAMPELTSGRGDPTSWRVRGLARDTTDSSGKFELRGLLEGTYRLRVGREGGMAAMMQRSNSAARTGDHDVRLVLEDDGKVKGKVLYADGSAPDTYMISANPGQGTPFAARDGSFEISAQPGAATLWINGPTFVQKTVGNVEVKGGGITDVGTITVEKGRSLSGRVFTPAGGPASGAKVMAGPQLMGSGTEMAGGGIFGMPGVKTTTADENGGYVLTGVGARGLVVVAETADGRSNMVRVPAGTESAQIDLPLRTFGALQGKVTMGGKPVAALVIAQPQQASKGNFIVKAGDDGAYRFDKLTPDTYRVSAMQGQMMSGGMEAKVVTVTQEQTVDLNIEMVAEGVTVLTNVAGPAGARISTAQVFLVQGQIQASNADQFTELIGQLGGGSMHHGFVIKGEPAKLENVKPGSYSACGIPIPGDINSPADMMKLRDQMDKLLVACAPVTITASPKEQTLTVNVPSPPPL